MRSYKGAVSKSGTRIYEHVAPDGAKPGTTHDEKSTTDNRRDDFDLRGSPNRRSVSQESCSWILSSDRADRLVRRRSRINDQAQPNRRIIQRLGIREGPLSLWPIPCLSPHQGQT